jgi:hypothetical protein
MEAQRKMNKVYRVVMLALVALVTYQQYKIYYLQSDVTRLFKLAQLQVDVDRALGQEMDALETKMGLSSQVF